jgi:hypothetical protein
MCQFFVSIAMLKTFMKLDQVMLAGKGMDDNN